MKRKYKSENIFIACIVFLIIVFFSLIAICKLEYKEYQTLTGIVHDSDKVKLILDNSDSKLIQQNNYIYWLGKKRQYKNLAINRKIFKKDNKYYNEIIINIDLNNKTEIGEYIDLSIFKEKNCVFYLFKNIWKEKK